MTVQYLKQGLSTIHTWRGCPIQAKLMVYIPTTSVNSEVPMTSMEPMGIIPVNNSKQSQPTSGCKLNETFLNQLRNRKDILEVRGEESTTQGGQTFPPSN